MTAEIAIMNRHAVVLAADSATTVTSWKEGIQEKRYFKGANKLFELSRHAPVGLMIYGSAGLQGVPWELAVKTFRDGLGDKKHDTLSGYATEFFDYVHREDKLFTAEQKKLSLTNLIGAAAGRLQDRILYKFGAETVDELAAVPLARLAEVMSTVAADIDSQNMPDLIQDADIAAAIANNAAEFANAVVEILPIFKQSPERSQLAHFFAETLIKLAIKEFCYYADRTGIVIAGYGNDDYFPVLEVYECYGFLGERLICSRKDDLSRVMDSSAPAVIQPFATTSMIDTFRFGVAEDVFGAVFNSTLEVLPEFAKQVMEEVGAPGAVPEARLLELAEIARNQHTDRWFKQTRDQHFSPLSNVIHSLPLPDMAGLAKSLIELESLKERVTKPSESVSGPIDVAVISKHDGFVWIDRKHYFKAELNPRFMKRMG